MNDAFKAFQMTDKPPISQPAPTTRAAAAWVDRTELAGLHALEQVQRRRSRDRIRRLTGPAQDDVDVTRVVFRVGRVDELAVPADVEAPAVHIRRDRAAGAAVGHDVIVKLV